MYHTVRKKHLAKTKQLDRICRACGETWTKTARAFWRTYRSKGIWLSKYDMQQWVATATVDTTRKNSSPSHQDMQVFAGKRPNPMVSDQMRTISAQTRQETVSSFYDALNTWRKARKKMKQSGNDGFRPPYKGKKFYKAQWNYTGIKIRDGQLRLTCGRNNDPVLVDWPHPKPRSVEIGYDTSKHCYEVRAKYRSDKTPEMFREREPLGEKTAGVDLGEIHIAVAHDGQDTLIINGREIRSERRLLNKTQRAFDQKIDRKEKGSNRFWKLVDVKRERIEKIRNRIEDILHRQSTRLVEELWKRGTSTIVIGDVTGIRENMDYGAKTNQKLHQWCFRRFSTLVQYKAERYGMQVESTREAYTSQTCPSCGHRKKPSGRVYACSECGAVYHRDQVGAMNIRQKYLGEEWQEGYLPKPDLSRVAAARTTATGDTESPNSSLSVRKTPAQGADVLMRETLRSVGLSIPEGFRFDPHARIVTSEDTASDMMSEG